MKKLLIFAGLAVLTAGCNKIGQNSQTNSGGSSSTTTSTSGQTQSTQPQTQTYVNSAYNFQLTYPIYMTFVNPNYANLDTKIVQLQISKDQYPNTNFGDAGFAVSENYAKSLSDCLSQNPPDGSDGFKTPVKINGVQFYSTKSNGVGAGNIYQGMVYRTLAANGECLELSETIHTGNIDNYPQGSVTQVNTVDIQSKLDSVLNSFKFTN